MPTLARTATTDMEVTSIRLERELKEKLKDLSNNQGYQALIRDILWNYVNQRSSDPSPPSTPPKFVPGLRRSPSKMNAAPSLANPLKPAKQCTSASPPPAVWCR
jgi:hypothetical protein